MLKMGQSTSNTYVAVQSGFPHDVYVKCDSESLKLSELDDDEEMAIGASLNIEDELKDDNGGAGVKAGANAELRNKCHRKFLAKTIEIGFSTIKPGEFLEFDVPVQNTHTVYITIYANNEKGKLFHPLCVNLPKNINDHIMVENNGQVVQSSDTDLFKRKEYGQ